MERFYFEIPSISRKEDAINYINEFFEYNSNINGAGGLSRYRDNYEGWLEKLEEDYNRVTNEEKVPTRTFFFVRENDNKIVGMINIRLDLNEEYKNKYGHIGYGIRPTERGKGYNKINLYLGLKVCYKHGINEILMSADIDNPASWRTIESVTGKRIIESGDNENPNSVTVMYHIDVKKSLEDHKEIENRIVGSKMDEIFN